MQYISSSGGIRFYPGTGGSTGTPITFAWTPSTGTWYHLALTRDASNNVRMFVDGVQIGSTSTNTDDLSSTGRITIGDNFDVLGNQELNGYISNLRILKGTALYTSNFTPPTRLLTAVDNTALLTCQKETIRDGSVGIHTVTPNGNAAANLGFPSSSYEFDGVDDYITLDENSDLANITGDISIEAWFNIDTTNNGNRAIWSKGRTPDPGGGSQTHSLLWVSSSNTIGGLIGNLDGTASSVGQTIITAGQWYHVVLTSDGSNNRIYINGVLDDTNARTSAEIYNTNQNGGVSIGRDVRYPTTSNRMWDGEIGEVRVYPRALTASEVLQNYNATKGRYGI